MAHKITVEATQFAEFQSLYGKKIVATVRASSIKTGVKAEYPHGLPLDANVRRPSRNVIVKGLLESLASFQGTYYIRGQINVVCRSVRVVKRLDSDSYLLELNFAEGDGVTDGGHRLETIRLANLNKSVYPLDNVFAEFSIEEGLPKEAIRQKAIAENTSKNPSKFSVDYHKGVYDWLEDLIRNSPYKYVRFYEGQEGTLEGPHCAARNLSYLPLLVAECFNPSDMSDPKKRHPAFLASNTGAAGFEQVSKSLACIQEDIKKQKLFVDLLGIYCDICKEINKRSSRTPIPHVSTRDSVRLMTHLPDGTLLSCRIPARLYTAPILSMFRVAIDGDEWKIPLAFFQKKLIASCLSFFLKKINHAKRNLNVISTIHKDYELWDSMYAHALEVFEDIEKEYFSLKAS